MGRVAVVHDYLSQFGGAERVALALADTFDAPIYTSLYQPDLTFSEFRRRDVRTTWLQKAVPHGRFRWAGPVLGTAFSHLDLSEFETVVVSSSGFAHHIRHPNAYVYCHTPPRFIYDLEHYSASKVVVTATRPFLPWLRRKDQQAAAGHEHYAANSAATAERIAAIYGKSARVIHPVLRTDHLPPEASPLPGERRALVLARLLAYKRIDVAIAACRLAGIPLTIAGSGPDETRLKALARGDGVSFLGPVDDSALPDLFDAHSVVLVPGAEDFGLAPVEANHAGRPVVAQAAGGAVETVVDGVTGTLVTGHDPEKWAQAIRSTVDAQWDPKALRDSTEPYRMPAFRSAVRSWVGLTGTSESSDPVVR